MFLQHPQPADPQAAAFRASFLAGTGGGGRYSVRSQLLRLLSDGARALTLI